MKAGLRARLRGDRRGTRRLLDGEVTADEIDARIDQVMDTLELKEGTS